VGRCHFRPPLAQIFIALGMMAQLSPHDGTKTVLISTDSILSWGCNTSWVLDVGGRARQRVLGSSTDPPGKLA
jgi:hypothetical protein